MNETLTLILAIVLVWLAISATMALMLLQSLVSTMSGLSAKLDKIKQDKDIRPEYYPISKPNIEASLSPFKPGMKVDQLSPEMIAPALKKPPKPPGGFGSKVNDN